MYVFRELLLTTIIGPNLILPTLTPKRGLFTTLVIAKHFLYPVVVLNDRNEIWSSNSCNKTKATLFYLLDYVTRRSKKKTWDLKKIRDPVIHF